MSSKKAEVIWASISEGSLILATGLVALGLHAPLIFSSLGPTIYEQIEMPNRRSAAAYSILVGHFLALGVGFGSLYITHAWGAPKVVVAGYVTWPRIWASVLAVTVTVLLTLLLKASQPASLATALLVTIGSYDTAWKALAIVVGVITVTVLGQPLRYLRKQEKPAS
jgi:hypothetical protein